MGAGARLGGLLAGAGLAAGAVALVLLAGEVALRVAGYRPPVLIPTGVKGTYRFKPGAAFEYVGYRPGSPEEFRVPIVLNSLGFRDREYAPERPDPRTYRVLVLGDSYVAAMEVENRQAFHKLLEERLNREDPLGRGSYEVIALGQGNRAQRDELRWLRAQGPRFAPDLVLLVFFCGNDVMENHRPTYSRAQRYATFYLETIAPRKIRFYERAFLVRRSRLSGFVAARLTDLYAARMDLFHGDITPERLLSPDMEVYRTPPAEEWIEAWRVTAGLLEEVRAEAATLGAGFAMAVISGPQVIAEASQERLADGGGPGYDLGQPERWTLGWCERAGVPCLALGEAFEAAGPRRVYWRHDAHLTPYGHRAAAEALYPWLVGLAKENGAGKPPPRRQRLEQPASTGPTGSS